MKLNKINKPKIRIRRPRIRIRWKKRTSKWVIGFATSFFVLLFIFQILLMTYAENILRNILNNRVQSATEGLYSTLFDEIDISYTSRNLVIHNLYLVPDSTKLQELKAANRPVPSAYKIFIPELRINGINIQKAYLKKRLDVKSLVLKEPKIELTIDFDFGTSYTENVLKEDLYSYLSPTLKALAIDSLLIESGNLKLVTIKNDKKSIFNAKTLNLQLTNVVVDDASNKTNSQLFYADNLFFEADSLMANLADSTYYLYARTFKASSQDSSAYLENMVLIPTKDKISLAKSLEKDNIYQFTIPYLYLYGVDYVNIYQKGELKADEINLISPEFSLLNLKEVKPGQKESFKPENLYPIIDKVLNSVFVRELYLRNGKATIEKVINGKIKERLNTTVRLARINNFVLDSTSHMRPDKFMFSDSVNIDLRNYSLRLSDETHILKASQLYFSTNEREIFGKNLALYPDSTIKEFETLPAIYQASIPKINLTGVDILRAYNENSLKVDSFLISKPTVKYSRRSNIERKKQQVVDEANKSENLYNLISDYLYELQVKKIEINKGLFHAEKVSQGKADVFTTKVHAFDLWDFRLDSTSAYELDKLFYAENFDLKINDYSLLLADDTHEINAKEIGISTFKDEIYVDSLVISAQGLSYPFTQLEQKSVKTVIDLRVPSLKLKGIDILKSYLTKKLRVKEVSIEKPTLHFGKQLVRDSVKKDLIKSITLYKGISDYLELISVEKAFVTNSSFKLILYATNGPLIVTTDKANLEINKFHFDSLTALHPEKLFFAKDVEFSVDNFLMLLPDEVHQVSARQIYASTQNRNLSAAGVKIAPLKEEFSDAELARFEKKSLLHLELPTVEFSNINLDEAYYKEKLHIDTIFTRAPTLNFVRTATAINGNSKKDNNNKFKLNETSLYDILSPYMDELSVNRVIMEHGMFNMYRLKNQAKRQTVAMEGFTLNITNFLVNAGSERHTNKFLYSEDIAVGIEFYAFNMPDSVHLLTAEDISLSTSGNSFQVRNIHLAPGVDSYEEAKIKKLGIHNLINVHIPALDISGVQFNDIYRNEKLNINKLQIEYPEFAFGHYKKRNPIKNRKEDYNLYSLIKGLLTSVSVKEAIVSKAKGSYHRLNQDKDLSFKASDLSAHVRNFYLDDSAAYDTTRFFYSEDIRLMLDQYERYLADSLHVLRFGNLLISTGEKEMIASDVIILPKDLTNYDSALVKANTNKLFRTYIPKIQLSGIDFNKLNQDSLLINNLAITDPYITLYSFNHLKPEKKPITAELTRDLYRNISSDLSLLKFRKINLKNGSFTMKSINKQDTTDFTVKRIFAVADNFELDSLSNNRKDKFYYADNIKFRVKEYSTTIDNGFYHLGLQSINLSAKEGTLEIDSLSIVPAYGKATFAELKGYETDQFTLKNKKLTLTDIQLNRLLNLEGLVANKLSLDGFELSVHRDKRQPFPEDQRPKMPQEALRNLNFLIYLNGIEINNGYISYSERAKGTVENGFIDLTNFYAKSDTISNHPDLLAKGLTTNLTASFNLLGRGKLNADFVIPMADTLNRHSFSGVLDEMDLPEFNSILENTVFVKIKSGHASRISFQVDANKENAEGTMRFEYDDLKVALVNKKTGKTGGPVKQFGTFLANAFVVNSSNTQEGKKPLREGNIEYKRDERRSIINYWIKTLVDGFKSSIGM